MVNITVIRPGVGCHLCTSSYKWMVIATVIRAGLGCHLCTSSYKWMVIATIIRAGLDSTHTRLRLERIQKNLGKYRGFSGAYETRTRDLLRDRQAF